MSPFDQTETEVIDSMAPADWLERTDCIGMSEMLGAAFLKPSILNLFSACLPCMKKKGSGALELSVSVPSFLLHHRPRNHARRDQSEAIVDLQPAPRLFFPHRKEGERIYYAMTKRHPFIQLLHPMVWRLWR
jgi:hypothetical protein